MNARIEAAHEALAEHVEPSDAVDHCCASLAVEAADAVMFSDGAVERAAKAMPHDQICGGWAPCDCWELRKTIVRAVIAALKGDA